MVHADYLVHGALHVITPAAFIDGSALRVAIRSGNAQGHGCFSVDRT